jgi:hypothetical protein
MGLYAEFPGSILLKSVVYSMVFGPLVAGNTIKAAYKKREEIDKNDMIGYT